MSRGIIGTISREDSNVRVGNIPMLLGAVDGKHIQIKHPPRSGSQFFNCKRFINGNRRL